MIDDYTNEDGEGILDNEELVSADDVFIKRFVAALQDRLTLVTEASTSAANFRAVAQVLGEITQDEALIATLNAERKRRVTRADKRRKEARVEFRGTLRSLDSSLGPVVQGVRFAVHEAVTENARASIKLQEARERRDKAEELVRQAESDKTAWRAELAAAEELAAERRCGPSTATDNDIDERTAANALVHYKEAQAQYRSEVAEAQWDYADRLRSLRAGQSKRLESASIALTADTVKALPDAKGEERGTKISLRAVR